MIGAVTLSVLLSSGIPLTMLLPWRSGVPSPPVMIGAFRVPALLSSGILFTTLLSWRWAAGLTDRSPNEPSRVAVAYAAASQSLSRPCMWALLAATAPVLCIALRAVSSTPSRHGRSW